MPDRRDCIYLSPSAAQERIRRIVEQLVALDDRLSVIGRRVRADRDAVLPAELRAGVDCVRRDLLSDAIGTLTMLGSLTEISAFERRVEAVAAVERMVAFGWRS